MKTCNVCHTTKEFKDFSKSKISKDGRRYDCKACNYVQYREWCANNPEKYAAKTKRINEKRKASGWKQDPNQRANATLQRLYGITLEQKTEMWMAQDKKCAICPRELPSVLRAHTDHCHITGKVRAILCGPCNSYLGNIKENFNVAIKLAKYIQEHNEVL